jgi:hypothetical protein
MFKDVRRFWFSSVLMLAAWFGISAEAQAARIKVVPIGATASGNTSQAMNACDGNRGTVWNSGASAPQWIRFDLGKPMALQQLTLVPAVYPNPSQMTYEIWGGPLSDQLHIITSGTVAASNSTDLPISTIGTNDNAGNIRYLELRVTSSQSWVAFYEVEIYRNVDHFGHMADAFESPYGGNLISETSADGANTVWVSGTTPNWYHDRVADAKTAGKKAMLHLMDLLLDANGNLNADWQTRVRNARYTVTPDIWATVVGVCPFDRGSLARLSTETVTTVMTDLRTNVFPAGTRFLGIFSAGDIVRDLSGYSSKKPLFDDLGVICENSPDACGDGATAGGALSLLMSPWRQGARVMVFPSAHTTAGSLTTEIEGQRVVGIDQWTALINRFPMISGVFGSQWSWGKYVQDRTTYMTGTRVMPITESRMKMLGLELTTSAPSAVYPVSMRASSSYPGTMPFFAFDGAYYRVWNSGGFPPGWIIADFTNPVRIKRMELILNQTPGYSSHRVTAITPTGNVLLTSLEGQFGSRIVIPWSGVVDAYSILVETTSGASWVAWEDIKFYSN